MLALISTEVLDASSETNAFLDGDDCMGRLLAMLGLCEHSVLRKLLFSSL